MLALLTVGGADILVCFELRSEGILALRSNSSPLGGSEYALALADPRQAGMPTPPNHYKEEYIPG
jgi:hypothetical protein